MSPPARRMHSVEVNGGHIGWSSWAFQRCAKTGDSICGCYRFFKGWSMWLYPCLVGWVCLCAGHMPMLVNLILMCVGYFHLTKLLISYDFSCLQCLTVDSPTMTLPTRPLPRTSSFTAKDLARQLTPRRCQRRSMQRSRNEWTKNRTCLSTAPQLLVHWSPSLTGNMWPTMNWSNIYLYTFAGKRMYKCIYSIYTYIYINV